MSPLYSCTSLKKLETFLIHTQPKLGKGGGRKFVLDGSSQEYSFNQLILQYQLLLSKTNVSNLNAFKTGARIAILLTHLNQNKEFKNQLTRIQKIKLKARQAFGNLLFAALHGNRFSRTNLEKAYLAYYKQRYETDIKSADPQLKDFLRKKCELGLEKLVKEMQPNDQNFKEPISVPIEPKTEEIPKIKVQTLPKINTISTKGQSSIMTRAASQAMHTFQHALLKYPPLDDMPMPPEEKTMHSMIYPSIMQKLMSDLFLNQYPQVMPKLPWSQQTITLENNLCNLLYITKNEYNGIKIDTACLADPKLVLLLLEQDLSPEKLQQYFNFELVKTSEKAFLKVTLKKEPSPSIDVKPLEHVQEFHDFLIAQKAAEALVEWLFKDSLPDTWKQRSLEHMQNLVAHLNSLAIWVNTQYPDLHFVPGTLSDKNIESLLFNKRHLSWKRRVQKENDQLKLIIPKSLRKPSSVNQHH